jgi:rubrerythrin
MAYVIKCLSLLEDRTAQLYRILSEKAEVPLSKSLLLAISQDSSKHSGLLRGISDTLTHVDVKEKDCAITLGQPWKMVTSHLKQAMEIQKPLTELEFYHKLSVYESILGEEYAIFVQMKTLQHLSTMIKETYNISLEKVKEVFESIIGDEEKHKEYLATLKENNETLRKEYDYTPIVKYQTPDKWIKYSP